MGVGIKMEPATYETEVFKKLPAIQKAGVLPGVADLIKAPSFHPWKTLPMLPARKCGAPLAVYISGRQIYANARNASNKVINNGLPQGTP
jgi:hypothetical protein